MALLVLFSVLSYSLFIKPAPRVKAATVDSTSSSSSLGGQFQRHEVVSSKGTIVAFFNAGTQDVTGLAYAKSTDNGATWSSATQIDSAQTNDFSVTIDGSDNIYVAYDNAVAGQASILVRELTYSAGSWSVGSANTAIAGQGCAPKIGYSNALIAINSSGVVEVLASELLNNCSLGIITGEVGVYSSNLTSWTNSGSPNNDCNGLVAVGNSFWAMASSGLATHDSLYVNISGNGSWTQVPGTTLSISPTPVSLSYSLDTLNLFYNLSGTGLVYQSYNISTGVFSSTTTLSSSTNDVLGEISSDSQNLWAAYQSFVGASSYNVVYKRFDGTSWDVSATSITTDNLNNVSVNLPERMPNTANVPVLWETGTGSPYAIKAASFSTIGSVTDTGNQTASYSGSLTGSSGDVIVKCGVWYYNTVNIVAGMTIKVCASNGQTGGTLEIHANSVTVAGNVDGAGRGLPGGAGLAGTGGSSGFGGTGGACCAGGTAGAGAAGGAGISFNGGAGTGSNGGSNGSAGTSDSAFGTGGAAGLGAGPKGLHGSGASTTAGTSGSAGGYLSSGGNGDSSIDFSLVLGSGGGAGGSGGSGAGGGGGGGGTGSCATGGFGGAGGNGGVGGKGGSGGAIVKIFSIGSVSVSGSVITTGQAGGSAGGANNGGGGANGATANTNC